MKLARMYKINDRRPALFSKCCDSESYKCYEVEAE